MKGIVLAGGAGSRLYPTTKGISKHLLPVYDKPTIYYSISVLMLAGIRDILIISTPRDLPLIEGLLGTGESIGLRFSYGVQDQPRGIAEAFLIGEDFIADDSTMLILGDNIFYGQDFPQTVQTGMTSGKGASIFAYHVSDPERFGVVTFDGNGKATKLEEKPISPTSNWAVTGLYIYDQSVVKVAKSMKPSARGELEITDLNRVYLDRGDLHVQKISRGAAWLDTGTPQALMASSSFVQTIEERQGLKIACLEEIAFFMKFIDLTQFKTLAAAAPDSAYGKYLRGLLHFGWIK